MKFKGVVASNFASLIEVKDIKQIESDVIDFVIYLKEKGYSLGSQKQLLTP